MSLLFLFLFNATTRHFHQLSFFHDNWFSTTGIFGLMSQPDYSPSFKNHFALYIRKQQSVFLNVNFWFVQIFVFYLHRMTVHTHQYLIWPSRKIMLCLSSDYDGFDGVSQWIFTGFSSEILKDSQMIFFRREPFFLSTHIHRHMNVESIYTHTTIQSVQHLYRYNTIIYSVFWLVQHDIGKAGKAAFKFQIFFQIVIFRLFLTSFALLTDSSGSVNIVFCCFGLL